MEYRLDEAWRKDLCSTLEFKAMAERMTESLSFVQVRAKDICLICGKSYDNEKWILTTRDTHMDISKVLFQWPFDHRMNSVSFVNLKPLEEESLHLHGHLLSVGDTYLPMSQAAKEGLLGLAGFQCSGARSTTHEALSISVNSVLSQMEKEVILCIGKAGTDKKVLGVLSERYKPGSFDLLSKLARGELPAVNHGNLLFRKGRASQDAMRLYMESTSVIELSNKTIIPGVMVHESICGDKALTVFSTLRVQESEHPIYVWKESIPHRNAEGYTSEVCEVILKAFAETEKHLQRLLTNPDHKLIAITGSYARDVAISFRKGALKSGLNLVAGKNRTYAVIDTYVRGRTWKNRTRNDILLGFMAMPDKLLATGLPRGQLDKVCFSCGKALFVNFERERRIA